MNVQSTDGACRQARVFVWYSHNDEEYLDQLRKHLAGLERSGVVSVWYDRQVEAGAEWEAEILGKLRAADVILLLISPDFMASDYCYDIEMEQALKRHEDGKACVIPVILRDVLWQDIPFGKLQAVPKDGRPTTRARPRR